MLEINLDTSKLGLEGLGDRLNAELTKALKTIGRTGVTTVKRYFDRQRAVASGRAKNSIHSKLAADGKSIDISASGSRAKAMRYIENGRGLGKQPPVKAIREWMNAKGISTGDERTDRGVAFLIARKIGRDGSPGHEVLFYATPEIEARAMEELNKAVKRALKQAV